MTGHSGKATIDIAIAASDGSAPAWVHLLPAGRFEGAAHGGSGPWTVVDPEAVIEASLADGRPLMIDYDHQAEFGAQPGVGGTAPAAGWITRIEARGDGLWGLVEWTRAGARAIAEREYRFLSPVFTYDKKTGAVSQILRAGLTNTPALTLQAIASRGDSDPMEDLLKELRKLLKLADDADDKAATAAVTALCTRDTALTAGLAKVAEAAGLKPETGKPATVEAIATAIASIRQEAAAPDPAKFVPVETHSALAARVKALEAAATEGTATAAVDQAIEAGKVLPAQRDWAMAYAAKDLAGFEAFVANQPVIVAKGTKLAGKPGGSGGDALCEEELAICRHLGISAEDFRKQRDAAAQEQGVAV